MGDIGKAIRSSLLTARRVAHSAENAAPEGRAAGGGIEQILPLIAGAAPAIGNALQSKANGFAKGGALAAEPIENAPQRTKPEQNPDLFDFSNLSKQPDVAQFDLPRNIPARGVPERMQDVTGSRAVQRKMEERIHSGLGSSGAAWYNTDPLKEEFIRRLGPEKGQLAHQDYMHFVAATSPREKVPRNVFNAGVMYHAHVSGKGIPAEKGKGATPEDEYKGLPLHVMNANRYVAGEWSPKNNPKPLSFAQNLVGNWKPGTMDTHAFRLPAILAKDTRFLDTAYDPNKGRDKIKGEEQPKRNIRQEVESGKLPIKDVKPGMWLTQPGENEYAALEDYYKKLAKKLGISTAQAQAAAWVGGGDVTGLESDPSKTFLHFFQDRVYKTAKETGVDPETVMKDFITGKIPLRANGGVVENALRLTRGYAPGGGIEQSFAPENMPGVGISANPGKVAGQSTRSAPDRDQINQSAGQLFKTPQFGDAVHAATGLRGVQFKPVHGSWEGKPEASFLMQHPGMTAAHARKLAALLGFGFQQDAAVAYDKAQPGDPNTIPTALTGHDGILSPQDIARMRAAAQKEGLDYSTTGDGRYAKFMHFGDTESLPGFMQQVKNIAHSSGFDKVGLVHSKSELINADQYLKELSGHSTGSLGTGRTGGGHPSASSGPSLLFRRAVDHILVPHARAIGAQGFRTDPGRIAAASRLTPDQQAYLRQSLAGRAEGGSVVDKALAVTAPRQQLNQQGLYSHAAAQAQALSQAKGSGQQMLASLKGVKPEELANSGAAQKFAGQPSVTRDELASHFRRSLPKIQETRLSESDADDEENEDSERPGAPNFEEYTIPGGENYRELLLHTPAAPPDYKKITTLQGEHNRARIALDHYLRTNGIARVNQDPEYARVSAEERSAREALDVARKEPEANNFYHRPHWGNIPNVVAHLRLTDRTVPTGKTPESDDDIIDSTAPSSPERRARFAAQEQAKKGERVLHMEELQSDWGQQGREKGFKEPVSPELEAKAMGVANDSLLPNRKYLPGFAGKGVVTREDIRALSPEQISFWERTGAVSPEQAAVLKEHEKAVSKEHTGVPKGPYVGTTNGWTDLGLKRALREAALGKYDRLAWTPGQEQADRYGLAKKLSHLAYHPGVQRLLGTEHGASHPAIEENDVTPEKLPSYVGKELAERLLASEKDANGAHSVAGKDLQVGAHKMKKYYDEMVPGRLKEIVKKLGHEAKFEPLTIRHKPTPGGGYPDNMKTTLHSMHITPELRERILKGMPAYASGGAIAKKSTSAYAAGGNVADKEPEYDVHEDGPFYRVARRGLEGVPGGAGEVRAGARQEPADDGRGGGPLLGGTPQPDTSRQQALQGIANAHAAAHGRGPVVDEGNLPASLHKQSAIGAAFGLAATDRPDYKHAVFEAYKRQQPHVVKAAGARNYDELRAAAYHHLGKETSAQFDSLPIATSYHRNGEGSYASSPEMLKDLHENGHLNVFRGGDRHDFLHNVDPRTGLNENEKFRAVHDAIGHGVFGNGFGPQGEERAWNAHRQTFSPLAQLALASETRGQNSYVNYTPLNAQLLEDKHKHETNIATAKRMGWRASAKKAEDAKAKLMKEWQYAPQKAVLLPPEMTDPKYAGGMPDYVHKLMKPEPGTGMSAPVTHYSPSPDLKELDPSRYGTGIAGDEAKRLQGSPGAVAQRSYAYLGNPGDVPPEPGLGSHAYVGQAHDLYDMSKDPLRLAQLAIEANRGSPLGTRNPGAVNQGQASNDTERMAQERGFQGVANPNAAFPMAALFNKTPVQPAEDPVRKASNLTIPAGG